MTGLDRAARAGRRLVAAAGDLAFARNPVPVAVATTAGIAAGGVAWIAGRPDAAGVAWAIATWLALVPLCLSVARDLLRRDLGVDVIALLAMAGALALGQFLAGAVIALMLSGGLALERYAGQRARRELTALLERAPRSVNRHEGGQLVTRPVEDVRAGDRLLVMPGEVVPVDGRVSGGKAVLDESALTGEARPAEHESGDLVRSGCVNAGAPFDLEATTTAAESTYAGIVRLVREAQASKAPFVRLADRYGAVFLPLTLAVAGLAWAISHDPVRALAVLVVATPCPLILAAPVAIVSGVSRAARHGVVIKGGGALETLARAVVVLIDKTGTLTAGSPRVTEITVFPGAGLDAPELLGLAASLDQVSPHVFAAALVGAARERRLPLTLPVQVVEHPGDGIEGLVNGRRVALGKAVWAVRERPLPETVVELRRRATARGASSVFVSVDGVPAGALVLEDPMRDDSPSAVAALRAAGVKRVVLVTGDHAEVARTAGSAIGADAILADCSPQDKVAAVASERHHGVLAMIGDGINDAPALAAADVGVAMGARGATASSEAADVVVLVDRIDRLAEGLAIARHARGIAVQSVVVGMGLSIAAMVVAAMGLLPPVGGAMLQEGIDVLVILNALRALGGAPASVPAPTQVPAPARLPADRA